jgi:hypothetical protein
VAYIVEDYIWDTVVSDAWDKELAQVGFFWLSVHPSSFCLHACQSLPLFACLPACLPVYISVYPFMCLSV